MASILSRPQCVKETFFRTSCCLMGSDPPCWGNPGSEIQVLPMHVLLVLFMTYCLYFSVDSYPDSKVHGANMVPTWVLSAPDGSHVGPMNLAIRVCLHALISHIFIPLRAFIMFTSILTTAVHEDEQMRHLKALILSVFWYRPERMDGCKAELCPIPIIQFLQITIMCLCSKSLYKPAGLSSTCHPA